MLFCYKLIKIQIKFIRKDILNLTNRELLTIPLPYMTMFKQIF